MHIGKVGRSLSRKHYHDGQFDGDMYQQSEAAYDVIVTDPLSSTYRDDFYYLNDPPNTTTTTASSIHHTASVGKVSQKQSTHRLLQSHSQGLVRVWADVDILRTAHHAINSIFPLPVGTDTCKLLHIGYNDLFDSVYTMICIGYDFDNTHTRRPALHSLKDPTSTSDAICKALGLEYSPVLSIEDNLRLLFTYNSLSLSVDTSVALTHSILSALRISDNVFKHRVLSLARALGGQHISTTSSLTSGRHGNMLSTLKTLEEVRLQVLYFIYYNILFSRLIYYVYVMCRNSTSPMSSLL